MKRQTLVAIGLILLGFVLECLYLGTEETLFAIKFWLIGTICIIAGLLSLLLNSFLPALNFSKKKVKEVDKK